MNNARRKEIDKIISALQGLNLSATISSLEEIASNIETLKDEEQDAFDNMPEGLQQSDKGQSTEAAANNLDEAGDAVTEIVTALGTVDDIISKLESARDD